MTKKEEVSSLSDMLCHNGWNLSGSERDVMIFKLRLKSDKYYYTIRAEIAEKSGDMNYGIRNIAIDEGKVVSQITYEDLQDMQKAIEYAQSNLLMIGVPFVNEDLLHGTEKALNKKIQRNRELRIMYGLDKCEMPRTDKDVSFF